MTRSRRRHAILVAEDDHDLRRVIVDVLSRDGHLLQEACDGRELLERVLDCSVDPPLIESPQYDLVITDVRMPGRSGIDVLRQLRRAGVVTPVMLMTAFADEEARVSAKELGVVLLNKPFWVGDLRALVGLILASGT